MKQLAIAEAALLANAGCDTSGTAPSIASASASASGCLPSGPLQVPSVQYSPGSSICPLMCQRRTALTIRRATNPVNL